MLQTVLARSQTQNGSNLRWKMKIFSVLVLILTCGLVPCRADTTETWNVAAMCDPNLSPFFPFCSVPAKINAVFTTQMQTGLFFDPEDAFFFEGTEAVVTNITGTLDGLPMTLEVPGGESPFVGWLDDNGRPAGVAFVAGGLKFDLSLLSAPLQDVFLSCAATTPCGIAPTPGTFRPMETLDWSAVRNVPESSVFSMLLTGLLLLGLSRWAQTSLRKLSSC
jgi:hypothetical protein